MMMLSWSVITLCDYVSVLHFCHQILILFPTQFPNSLLVRTPPEETLHLGTRGTNLLSYKYCAVASYCVVYSVVFISVRWIYCPPITVAARSEAWNVFSHSNAGIVGSNPIQGIDVCVYSMFVLPCVGTGLASGWSRVQGILPTMCKIKKWRETKRYRGVA
jgi:hypothetical protein